MWTFRNYKSALKSFPENIDYRLFSYYVLMKISIRPPEDAAHVGQIRHTKTLFLLIRVARSLSHSTLESFSRSQSQVSVLRADRTYCINAYFLPLFTFTFLGFCQAFRQRDLGLICLLRIPAIAYALFLLLVPLWYGVIGSC